VFYRTGDDMLAFVKYDRPGRPHLPNEYEIDLAEVEKVFAPKRAKKPTRGHLTKRNFMDANDGC
jgi:hypothetical protein